MENQKIDVGTIFSIIRKNIKYFIYSFIIAFIVGLVIAFSLPKEYTSTVVLAPETAESSLSGNISSLASMVGAKLGNNSNGDAVYPQLYPEIFASDDFIVPLWSLKVKSQDGAINTSLYNYVLKHQKVAWWYKIIGATLNIFKSKNKVTSSASNNVLTKKGFVFTQEQYDATGAIKGMLKCMVDKKTDMITITTRAQDPFIAATVADSVQHSLQDYITKYRTTKARNDLAYTKKLYTEAKNEYEKARQRYGSYSDANMDVILQSYKSKQADLENDMQLKYNIYSQLTQQLQLAQAKVQEKTPAFTVIQSAVVPLKKASPRRGMIVIITMLIVSLGTLQYCYIKEGKLLK